MRPLLKSIIIISADAAASIHISVYGGCILRRELCLLK